MGTRAGAFELNHECTIELIIKYKVIWIPSVLRVSFTWEVKVTTIVYRRINTRLLCV